MYLYFTATVTIEKWIKNIFLDIHIKTGLLGERPKQDQMASEQGSCLSFPSWNYPLSQVREYSTKWFLTVHSNMMATLSAFRKPKFLLISWKNYDFYYLLFPSFFHLFKKYFGFMFRIRPTTKSNIS